MYFLKFHFDAFLKIIYSERFVLTNFEKNNYSLLNEIEI